MEPEENGKEESKEESKLILNKRHSSQSVRMLETYNIRII